MKLLYYVGVIKLALLVPTPRGWKKKSKKKAPFRELSFSLMTSVAGPEVASGLKDYEPFVHCTLPRM